MKIHFHQQCLHMFFIHLVRFYNLLEILLFHICLFKKDFKYPIPSSSAGDSSNRGKSPSRHPSISDSIFEYLCRSVDNDYIAHPTDCKRYAYCANGKKRDISSVVISSSFFFRVRTRDVWTSSQ